MQKIPEPPRGELEGLLFEQMMSKKKVALYYSVSKKTLNTWMRKYSLTNKTPVELQQLKRENTRKLKQIALDGKEIVKPGFNSEFLEEYAVEIETRKLKRQENIRKRKEEEKARKAMRAKKVKKQ